MYFERFILTISVVARNVYLSIYTYEDRNKFSFISELSDEDDQSYQFSSRSRKSFYVVAVSDGSKVGKLKFDITLYGNELSTGEIVAIVVGCVGFVVIFTVVIFCCVRCCKRRARERQDQRMNRYQHLDPQINIKNEAKPIQQNSQFAQPYSTGIPIAQSQTTKENEGLLDNNMMPVSKKIKQDYPYNSNGRKWDEIGPAYPTLDRPD